MRYDVKRLPGNMVLADPNFYKKGPIDLLLGAEYFVDILQHECKIVPASSDHPGFVKTVFGVWQNKFSEEPASRMSPCHR